MKTSSFLQTTALSALLTGFTFSPTHANDANQSTGGPLTHVPESIPANVPVQPKPENLPQHSVPQIPANAVPQVPRDVDRPARVPGPEVPVPQMPVMPDAPGARDPDHLLERTPGGDAHHDRIREDSVNRLFEDAVRLHPSELEGLRDAEELRQVPGLDGTAVDPHAIPGQQDAGLIPGQQRAPGTGVNFENQGFHRPEGMPESPVPTRTGRDAPRLVGPPSANLRGHGEGAAAQGGKPTIPAVTILNQRGTRTVYYENGEDHPATGAYEIHEGEDGTIYERFETPDDTGEKVLIVVAVTPPGEETQTASGVVPGPLDRLQDGDADPTGGSGVNPVTGLPTRPPKRSPDQVNPGPEGAVVLPAGTRLRPQDLEVNPDPERQGRGFNPGETMRRFESPDQVDPPPTGP